MRQGERWHGSYLRLIKDPYRQRRQWLVSIHAPTICFAIVEHVSLSGFTTCSYSLIFVVTKNTTIFDVHRNCVGGGWSLPGCSFRLPLAAFARHHPRSCAHCRAIAALASLSFWKQSRTRGLRARTFAPSAETLSALDSRLLRPSSCSHSPVTVCHNRLGQV